MTYSILNVLVESGTISQSRADILSGISTPSSAYGLYGDTGLEHSGDSDFLITDDELRALVRIENIISNVMTEASRDTALPLLMVILVRLLQHSKHPSDKAKAALDNVLSSFNAIREQMNEDICKAIMEQIDRYVCNYKMGILKEILTK